MSLRRTFDAHLEARARLLEAPLGESSHALAERYEADQVATVELELLGRHVLDLEHDARWRAVFAAIVRRKAERRERARYRLDRMRLRKASAA